MGGRRRVRILPGSARAVAADARVVGAIVAPFTRADTAARLVEAGVPVVSLSQEVIHRRRPASCGWGRAGKETRAAIAGLAGDDACLLTGQDPWGGPRRGESSPPAPRSGGPTLPPSAGRSC